MSFIWSLLVGMTIGAIAGWITKKRGYMGWIATTIAGGLIGSAIGQAVFGNWGPNLLGVALVPSIMGASLLVLVISIVFFKVKGKKTLISLREII